MRVCPIPCTPTWASTWLYWYHISIACKTWLSQQSMCLIITIVGVPTDKQNQGIIYNEVIMCYRVLQSSLTRCPVTWVHYWNHACIIYYNHLHDRPLGHVSYTLLSIPRLGRVSNADHSRSLVTTWQPPVIASRAYSQQSPTCTRVNQMYLIPTALMCISCFACGRGLVNGSATLASVAIFHILTSPLLRIYRIRWYRRSMCLDFWCALGSLACAMAPLLSE